ncbi:MAG: ribonuclease HII [Candidatus Promineofilum sp.]|nr:ribonuclease HII [Promineifilum sp.]
MALVVPDFQLERALAAECGVGCVAGVDEAGRGALAGPVFAAAVALPLNDPMLVEALREVRDSKLLSAAVRERLLPLINQHAVATGIGQASAATIDRLGILPATRQAMGDAIRALSPSAAAVLIDGPIRLAAVALPQRAVIRGDQLSVSVAAASILAKVSRDRYMVALHERFPDYGFARHKGYGTAEHRRALAALGPCPEHRLTFAPLAEQRGETTDFTD